MDRIVSQTVYSKREAHCSRSKMVLRICPYFPYLTGTRIMAILQPLQRQWSNHDEWELINHTIPITTINITNKSLEMHIFNDIHDRLYVHTDIYMGQVMELRLYCYLVCYQLIAKPGNKTAPVSWPNPYQGIYKPSMLRKAAMLWDSLPPGSMERGKYCDSYFSLMKMFKFWLTTLQ